MNSSPKTMESWEPKLSYQQCIDIVTKTPGSRFELETKLIDGRLMRAYKHTPPSLRHFWLGMSTMWANREYIVYEKERLTYGDVSQQAARAASVFYTRYGVRKGDRVGIVARNYPEWVVTWWACQLLGAVAVAMNGWLPSEPLKHCITKTDCKVLVLDSERANALSGWLSDAVSDSRDRLSGILVLKERHEPAKSEVWQSSKSWDDVMGSYSDPIDEWKKAGPVGPEDGCIIFFTSGTTGLPRGVLCTHRSFLTCLFNGSSTKAVGCLRAGLPVPELDPSAPQSVLLMPNPLFHTMGVTSFLMICTASGGRLVLMRKWDKTLARQLIKQERVTSMNGVPHMLLDLGSTSGDADADSASVESFSFGGAPAPMSMMPQIRKKFPNAYLAQGYGLTETAATVVAFSGPDVLLRPTSTGFPCATTELAIVDEKTLTVLPPGSVGEIWIRGPSIMKEYWRDPEATAKAITKDGWFRSGDLGYLDEEGFLYIRDRAKDIIIRGGENIDSVMVEQAIYADPRVMECAAVGVPDPQLGEQVAVAVTAKEEFRGRLSESDLIQNVRTRLPHFAVPVLILELDALPKNAVGKTLKRDLRVRLKEEWRVRQLPRVPAARL